MESVLRTYGDTRGAPDAFVLFVEALRKWRPAFGVMTPDTSQGTTLYEDSGAYARSVMDSIPFDIKY